MHVRVVDQVRIDGSGRSFKNKIAFKVFSGEGTGGRTEDHACIGRNQYLVVDVVCLGPGGDLGAGYEFNVIFDLLSLNGDGIGVNDGRDHASAVGGRDG